MSSTESDPSEAELRAGAEAGDPEAMFRLASALAERDESEEAERWYRRAADGGSARAMWALGDRAERREAFGEAERWFQRSADAGNASSMCRLGNLLFERGEYEEAERWLQAALDRGHEHALWRMVQVSELLDRHDTDRWFHRLDDTYELEPERLHLFGALRDARHREEEAAYWYRRAAEAGHTGSLERLPALFLKLGDSAETERWLQLLADTGDTKAMFELGHLLAGRGESDEAERWFRRSVEGSDDVAESLGGLLDDSYWNWNETEKVSAAREAMDRLPLAQVFPLHRAIGLGDPDVCWELGTLLVRCGYREHGKGWRWSAAEMGHLRALYEVAENLRTEDPALVEELLNMDGLQDDDLYEDCELAELEFPCKLEHVLTAWDRRDEHESRFRRAADSGHPKVMMWLGILLIHWGDEQEGQSWLQRAAEAGYPDAMYSLAMLLDSRGRQDDAQPWREQVTQYRRQVAEEAFYERYLGEYKFDRGDHQRFAERVAVSIKRTRRDSAKERQRLLAAT